VERLKDLEQKEESGYLDQLPKKEASSVRRELEKLRRNLNGIKNMKRLPDLVVIVDQKRESTAIEECIKLGITVISILDTNCDPDLADIPIPANDDAIRSVKLILSKLSSSISEGSRGALETDEIKK
jgi:small subunit ribosomal protein S2